MQSEGTMDFSLSLSARIDVALADRTMLLHPFYQAWSEGRLSLDVLRAYAGQYLPHVEAFPRAVRAVYANCPDVAGRRLLAENLAEEEGLGAGQQAHAVLWRDFGRGLGLDDETLEGAELNAESRSLVETFARLSRRSYAAGLGALYAYESQLPAVAATKIDGLTRFYGISDEATLRFFKVHEKADVEHSEVCRALLDAQPEADQPEALEAAIELADALWSFLSGLERQTGMSCQPRLS